MENKQIKHEEISFTKVVKEEISLFEDRTLEQYKAILSSFIKINSHLVLRSGEWVIVIKSENIKTAKLVLKQLKRIYNVDARVAITEKKKLRVNNDNKIVHIEIDKKAKEILKDLQIYSLEKGFECLPNNDFLGDLEVRKAYVVGAFLASGSVNSPATKNYHLEVAVNDKLYADFLIKLLRKFYLEPKQIIRRNHYVVYLKKSEQIADFLKVISAWQSLLTFEERRIQRDQFNSLNRLYNCEISNEKRAIEIGNKQAEAIRWFRDNIGLEKLDPSLKVVAEVRLNNPEATYIELTNDCKEYYNLQISKPGFSYRMKKLLEEINRIKGER